MAYPTTLDTFTNPAAADRLNSPAHHTQHSDANDAIEALEAKVGVNSSAVTTSHDYKLSGITGSAKAVSTAGATNLALTTPTITGLTSYNWSGWFKDTQSWTYVSPTSVTVPANSDLIYAIGDKLAIFNWPVPTANYFVVTAVASTTLTLTGGTDYTFSWSSIDPDVKWVSKAASAAGFPVYFNYTPTISYFGGTTDPTSNTINQAYFSVHGRLVRFHIQSTLVVGSGNRTFTNYTLPITRTETDYITFSGVNSFAATTVYGVAYSDSTTLVKVPVIMSQNGLNVIDGSYWI